jgi:hypothetical protein
VIVVADSSPLAILTKLASVVRERAVSLTQRTISRSEHAQNQGSEMGRIFAWNVLWYSRDRSFSLFLVASLRRVVGYASAFDAGVAGHTRTNHGVIEYPNHLACKEGVTASIPTTFTKGILKRGS